MVSFDTIIRKEMKRYRSKGYWSLVGMLIALSFFYVTPEFFKILYPYLPHTNKFLMIGVGNLFFVHYFYLLCSGCLCLIYYLNHPFFEQFKVSSQSWAWEENMEGFREQTMKCLKNYSVNLGIIMTVTSLSSPLLGLTSQNISIAEFPGKLEIFWQVIFMLLVQDSVFYWTHRALHMPFLYKHVHKQHHEYTQTLGFAAQYNHPIEMFVSGIFPTLVGSNIIGSSFHIVTFWIWIFVSTINTIDEHSGYDFPWSPIRLFPLTDGATYHDFHHSHNVGNYGGPFIFWDLICNTNTRYFKYYKIN